MKATTLFMAATLWCGVALAQVPHKITYQGVLADGSGMPVNATVSMAFKLYDVVSGGVALYIENHTVLVANGIFNVLTGTIPLAFDKQYYLGITVNSDPELIPRQPLAASPYAIRSASSDSLGVGANVPGSQITGTLTSATVPTSALTGTITSNQLAPSLTFGGTTTGTFSGPLLTIGSTVIDQTKGVQIGSNPSPGSGYSGPNPGLTVVGTPSAIAILEVHNSFAVGADFYTHAVAQFRAPYVNFFKSGGTQASPTSVKYTGYELDSIGGINFGGWDGSAYFAGSAAIFTSPDELWTPTSHGGHLSIYGTNNGGASTKQIAQFGGLASTGTGTTNNIIFYRPLTWGGNQNGNPGIFPASDPGVLAIRTGDNAADAALTVGTLTTSGNVGIGTPSPSQKLQVAGDVRIGTTGTNGCLMNFNSTAIAGTCSSDRRLKRDITPFPKLLDQVVKLQPVDFYWRNSEFPERHFGSAQSYGLIAQEVEQVLPELVAEDEQGYEMVDYSKLPLLLLQAVKDLKAENGALQQRNMTLDTRLEALEEMVRQLTKQRENTQ